MNTHDYQGAFAQEFAYSWLLVLKAPKRRGSIQEVMLGSTSQEVMPGETPGEAMRRKTSAEVSLLRRKPLRSTVKGPPSSEKSRERLLGTGYEDRARKSGFC